MLSRVGSYVRTHHVGLLACVLALSGSAYAADLIGPKDIARNAVRARHIKAHQIGAAHLRGTVSVSAEKTLTPLGTPGYDGAIVQALCPKGTRPIGFNTEWTGTGAQPQQIRGLSMLSRAVIADVIAGNGAGSLNTFKLTALCLRRGR